ncbi:MAG: DinB family protein, partial [Thermomicrobiales bacterium]
MRTLLLDYYDYTQWANERILDAAENVTPDHFLQPALPRLWSIRDTVAHIMISQWA